MTPPLVSVVMPAFNAAQTISESIASVQAQTEPSWELLLVVDRNSTDKTLQIAQACARADSRIRVICDLPEGGCVANRNHALRRASGTHIAFLDSDDLWLPRKLERQLKRMTEDKGDFSCTGYRQIAWDGSHLPIIVQPPERITHAHLLRDNVIGCLTVMYRRARFPDLRFTDFLHEDYILWLEMLRKTTAQGLPECLACYRVAPHSRSGNKVKAAIARWRILRDFEKLSLPVALPAFLSYAAVAVGRRRPRQPTNRH